MSSQYWKIVNVDKQERLPNHGGRKLADLMTGRSPEQLCELLASPVMLPVDPAAVPYLSKANHAVPILQLPLELLHDISTHLPPADAICLSLACTALYHAIGAVARAALAADRAAWAGTRIVTIGDYAEGVPTRCPEFRETKKMLEVGIAAMPFHPMDWGAWRYGPRLDPAHTANPLWHMSTEQTGSTSRLRDEVRWRLGLSTAAADQAVFDRVYPEPRSPAKSHGDGGAGDHEGGDDSSDGAVLRCLDTREFVSDRALAASAFAYSLGEVIAAWTCFWGKAGEGRWCGCRFDVVPLAAVTNEEAAKWTDVSQQAIGALSGGADGPDGWQFRAGGVAGAERWPGGNVRLGADWVGGF